MAQANNKPVAIASGAAEQAQQYLTFVLGGEVFAIGNPGDQGDH